MDSTKITADNLRKVAEYIGKYVQSITDGVVYIKHAGFQQGIPYTPHIKNSDQDSEIEVKFKTKTWWFEEDKLWKCVIILTNQPYFGMGTTPEEARLMAAIAYVENKDG